MKQRLFLFAHRVTLELLRDPLSYVFALGFPLVMLCIMTLVNQSIPKEAAMELFTLPSLAPAIWVFGMTFLMIFTAQLLSKDRTEAFLIRLYLSPMTSADFLLGYTLPVTVLGLLQGGITYLSAAFIGLFTTETLHPEGVLLSFAFSLPPILLFVSLGLLIGVSFRERAASGISSAIISAASLLGGIWMDVDQIGGVWLDICRILPFYHTVQLMRSGLSCTREDTLTSLFVVLIYTIVIFLMAGILFTRQKKQ